MSSRLLRQACMAAVAILMLVNLYLIFIWTPTESVMGHVQRIFYIHVPMAWIAFLAFVPVFIGSVLYLLKRDFKWDNLANSAAELGLVFTTLVLITGPIWAKPVWGIWWTWDARLTTTLILWFIYVGYLMLRSYGSNRSQGALYASVMGVIGFVDVPIVYFAVNWWRTQHQRLVVGVGTAEGSLHPDMRFTLYFSLTVFILLFLVFLWNRMSIRGIEDELRRSRRILNRLRKEI